MKDRIVPTIPATAWIAETAAVQGDVTLGEDVSIWFSVVIRGDAAPIRVGDRTNIQDGSVLHGSAGNPCVIGSDVTIGHGAMVHGCTIEDGVLVGIGAIVLDGAHVGQGAMVGAGALVPPGMNVPAGMLTLGVPAKIIGPVDEAKQANARRATSNYLQYKEEYRSGKY